MMRPRYETCEGFAPTAPPERALSEDERKAIVSRIVSVLAEAGLTYGQAYEILRDVRTELQVQAEFVKMSHSGSVEHDKSIAVVRIDAKELVELLTETRAQLDRILERLEAAPNGVASG